MSHVKVFDKKNSINQSVSLFIQEKEMHIQYILYHPFSSFLTHSSLRAVKFLVLLSWTLEPGKTNEQNLLTAMIKKREIKLELLIWRLLIVHLHLQGHFPMRLFLLNFKYSPTFKRLSAEWITQVSYLFGQPFFLLQIPSSAVVQGLLLLIIVKNIVNNFFSWLLLWSKNHKWTLILYFKMKYTCSFSNKLQPFQKE